MKLTKADEKLVQAQLNRIKVILTGNEYKSPVDKIGAISACTDIAERAILKGNREGSDEAKD